MELLRIIAMFLILTVHSDYYSLGAPTREDFIGNPLSSATRVAIESISLICVNLFVFISGWFGITLRRHKIADLLFQIAYFYFGIYIIALCSGKASVDIQSIKLLLLLTKHNWFIPAYLLLCILAPILNAFIESADKNRFRTVLIGFFAIQTWCGWLAESDTFRGGYSTISFIGIYLLVRYIRKYQLHSDISTIKSFVIFICSIAVNTILGVATTYTNHAEWLYMAYINPLTIIATVSFAMIFVNQKFQSKAVNFIAQSAFAVFLLHSNFNIVGYFRDINIYIFDKYNGIAVIALIFMVCCLWFAAAVILDQPRKWLWQHFKHLNATKTLLKTYN